MQLINLCILICVAAYLAFLINILSGQKQADAGVWTKGVSIFDGKSDGEKSGKWYTVALDLL
jgi:hypothetical protein